LSLCLTKHYGMKTYGGVGVQLHVFSTSALVGSERELLVSAALAPGEGALGTHSIGGRGGGGGACLDS
jgi:hypothetical protein